MLNHVKNSHDSMHYREYPKDGLGTEEWFNHGEQILRDCAKVWPAVQKIRDAQSMYVEVHVMGHGLMGDLWSFLEEHYEHGVELYNEWGKSEPIEEEVKE